MSNIIISTESGSDLPYKITVPYNIEVLPLHVNFGDKTLLDGSFGIDEIYSRFKQKKALPTTSAANPDEYVRHFRAIFDSYTDCKIIHITYSSKLSVTHQNALIAASAFDSGKICVIDSRNASAGAGAVVMLAAQAVERYGDTFGFDEYISLIKHYARLARCSFVPNSIEYLKAGGRISGLKYLGAHALNIKPSLNIRNGEIAVGKKYRGEVAKTAARHLGDFIRDYNIKKDFLIIGYSHGASVKTLFELKRRAHKLGFEKSWCFEISGAVTAHIGPGCIGFAGLSGSAAFAAQRIKNIE